MTAVMGYTVPGPHGLSTAPERFWAASMSELSNLGQRLPRMLALALSALTGLAIAWAFAMPIATMLVSTAPGGLAEMTLVAQALGIGVPLVVAFHFFRVVVVNMGAQQIFLLGRRVGRRLRPAAGGG